MNKAGLGAINNQVIFEFLEENSTHQFHRKTESGLIVVEPANKQFEYSRWCRVIDTGPLVSSNISVGDIVLVEHLRWTNRFTLDENPFWITTEDEVLAKWDDLENLPV